MALPGRRQVVLRRHGGLGRPPYEALAIPRTCYKSRNPLGGPYLTDWKFGTAQGPAALAVDLQIRLFRRNPSGLRAGRYYPLLCQQMQLQRSDNLRTSIVS
jgi:hypothetical protein